MSIDFEIPAEAQAIREKVRKWVEEECKPAERHVKSKEQYQETLEGVCGGELWLIRKSGM